MKDLIYDIEALSEACEPLEFITDSGINDTEGKEIVADLLEVMENNKSLLALSAPQLGIKKRIFCIRFNDTIKTFINPVITKKSGVVIGPETCSALPGKEILLARPEEITAVYYTDAFKYEDNKLLGAAAGIFDQMAQLLDGVLPSDLGLVSDVEQDGHIADITDPEEQQAIIDCYKQFVEAKKKALETEITADENISKTYRNLCFTESVINGRSQVIYDDPALRQDKAQQRAQAKTASKLATKNFVGSKK